MSPKYYLIAGTMFIAISFNSVASNPQSPAAPSMRLSSITTSSDAEGKADRQPSGKVRSQPQDKLQQILGVSSNEEIYSALYDGKSLAEMASMSGSVDQLIDLQLNELTQQLNERLASGNLAPEAYQAQLAELPGIIADSVHTKMTL